MERYVVNAGKIINLTLFGSALVNKRKWLYCPASKAISMIHSKLKSWT